MFKKKETSVPAGGGKISAELSDDQLDVVSGGVAGVNALDPLTAQDDPIPAADGQTGAKPITLTFSFTPNTSDRLVVYHFVNGELYGKEKDTGGPTITINPCD